MVAERGFPRLEARLEVEVCTRPTPSLSALRAELALLRKAMGEAAASEGCLLVEQDHARARHA